MLPQGSLLVLIYQVHFLSIATILPTTKIGVWGKKVCLLTCLCHFSAYLKLIDVWLLFAMSIPFMEIIFHTAMAWMKEKYQLGNPGENQSDVGGFVKIEIPSEKPIIEYANSEVNVKVDIMKVPEIFKLPDGFVQRNAMQNVKDTPTLKIAWRKMYSRIEHGEVLR